MKIKHDTLNVHRVDVQFSGHQVRDMLLDRVADKLHLNRSQVGKHLRVDLQSGATDTTYIRGEVPMTREEVLRSLKAGYSAEELVSMRGTALATLAREPGDHAATALLRLVDALDGTSSGSFKTLTSDGFGGDLVEVELGVARETGTSDVVPTPAEIERFREVAGDPDPKPRVDVSAVDEATTQVERLVRTLRRMPTIVEQARGCLDMMRRLTPDSVDVATTVRVFDEVVKVPGEDVFLPIPPARGPNPGCQVGTGHYVPESEELPEVQVDRAEAPATITVRAVRSALDAIMISLGRALSDIGEGKLTALVSTAASEARALHTTLGKYEDCILTEGGDSVVPRRGPTTDVIDTAREKVKHLYERQFHHGQAPRAQDLAHLYALLGGEDL